MYSALCPQCGAAIYRQQGGSQLVQCARCPWSGQVAFHYLPHGSQNGGSGPSFQPRFPFQPNIQFQTLPNGGGMLTTAPAMPTDPPAEPDPLDVRRDALRQRLADAVDAVNDELFGLNAIDWQMPAWRRYERLQEAHAALYTALGGARMGDYHPARTMLDEALGGVLFWALLTLDAVEG